MGLTVDAPGADLRDAGDPAELAARVRRLVAADGITYTPTGEAGRETDPQPQPWKLDAVPLVVDEDEFAALAAGVEQRSRLLAAVVSDLAGPRTLLARGLLPPEVVLGHHGHLPGAHGTDGPGALLLHAVDLARTAAGGVLALTDRTQAPSGLGYALADRRVLARAVPEHVAETAPLPLTGFTRALAAALRAAAPPAVEDPLVVVLSPGSHSETAFDQAYLAASLGLPLVQSADLTVHRGALWMRSLGDDQRVDVLLRRVDADFADPLDLRRSSQLGVSGLTEVVRRGGVRVVNGLGALAGENPALPAFLPALCRALLDEDLVLPSVPTWWCGDPASRSHVLARADDLVVHDLADGRVLTPRTLDAAARTRWAEELAAAPWRWVGRELVDFAASPVLGSGGTVGSAGVGLRVFTVDTPAGPTALPGALGRVVVPDPAGGLPRSGAAKDVWVRAAHPVETSAGAVAPATPRRPVAVALGSPRVLSDLHWLGRYAERAEGLARVLLAVHDGNWGAHPAARALLVALAPEADHPDVPATRLLADPATPGSVAASVAAAATAARGVREQLSGDTWAVLSVVDDALAAARRSRGPASWRAAAQATLTGLLALSGLVAENMVRDPGWYLLETGRRVERAQQVTALLAGSLGPARDRLTEDPLVETVLVATESVVTHRRRSRGRADAGAALELLLLDPGNPRGVAHQVAAAGAALRSLPEATGASRPELLVEQVLATLRRTEVAELDRVGDDGRRTRLAELLEDLHEQLRELGGAVVATHLRLPSPARQLEQSAARGSR
ncbi:circularly permuted type 2 ATP-grasp protein [Rhodococcus aerolatus]